MPILETVMMHMPEGIAICTRHTHFSSIGVLENVLSSITLVDHTGTYDDLG